MIPGLVTADDVCGAFLEALTAHLPAALVKVSPDVPLDSPVAFSMPSEQALRNGDNLPAVVVSSPGLSSSPERGETGVYTATWTVMVSVFARGDSYESTALHVRRYAAALRAAVLTDPSLGGLASELVWAGEEYDSLDAAKSRTIGGGFVSFDVRVDDVMRTSEPLTAPVVPEPVAISVTSTQATIHPAML